MGENSALEQPITPKGEEELKITLQQALDAMDQQVCGTCRQPNGLGALTELGKMKFASKVNWQIGRITKTIKDEVAEYFQAQNDKIVSYGNQVPPGSGQFKVPAEKDKEYQAEMKELRESDIEVYGEPIKLAELGAKADEINGEIFSKCEWLFSEGEEKAEAANG